MGLRRKSSVVIARVASLLAVMALSAVTVAVVSGLPDRTADASGGLGGVAAVGSVDHPGMLRVSWTSRPAAVFDLLQIIKIEWSGEDVTGSAITPDSAVLRLYADSPNAIVIPNLAGGTYAVSVSALTGITFNPLPAPATLNFGTPIVVPGVGVTGRPAGNPCIGVKELGEQVVMCGNVEDKPEVGGVPVALDLSGGVYLGQGSSGLFTAASTDLAWVSNDSGNDISSGRDLPNTSPWYRMRVQLLDLSGQIASQWWSAFGDPGNSFMTATDVLVPFTPVADLNSPRQPVYLPFSADIEGTTRYPGQFYKSTGAGQVALARSDIQRLCVQFFTIAAGDSDFSQELCASHYVPATPGAPESGGFFDDVTKPGEWRIRLKNTDTGYRVRFIDEANFATGWIAILRSFNALMTYGTKWATQWCGDQVDALQCGPVGSIGAARPVPAAGGTQTLDALLTPAGQLRVDVAGVPGGYSDVSPQDFVAYVEDTVTGRWFNAYVQKGPVVDGVATWGINAPGLVAGRPYRVFVQTFNAGELPAQRFFLGADKGEVQTFTAFSAQAESKPVAPAEWPQSFMIPYVVRVVKPNGDEYAARSNPDDDVCIAVIRRSDQRVMASSCVADNTLGFDGLVTLQPFPLDEVDPNTTYAAVAWKRNAGGAIVGSPYLLQMPNPLQHSEFVQTGYAEGFFDRRALNPGLTLPEFGGASTEDITVVVP